MEESSWHNSRKPYAEQTGQLNSLPVTLPWQHICNVMALYRKQIWLTLCSIGVFIYMTLLLNTYVLRSVNVDPGFQSVDSSGHGFRKLLEEDERSTLERHRIVDGYKKRLPQSIIFGVRKCGTRALIEFLDLHPQIKAADMEMHFFDENYNKGIEWYREQMPFSHPGQVTVEKTPRYFIEENSPSRIFRMNSSVKLIALFRNPIIRAISDYTQVFSNKQARNKTFEKFEEIVIDKRTGKVNTNYKAIRIGLYYYHLMRWLLFFKMEQIHIVDGDNLIANPLEEIAKVENFLGLEHKITQSNLYFNETRGFYCMKESGLGRERCLGATKGRKHPDIDSEVIDKLKDFYRPHNRKLFSKIGRKFAWD